MRKVKKVVVKKGRTTASEVEAGVEGASEEEEEGEMGASEVEAVVGEAEETTTGEEVVVEASGRVLVTKAKVKKEKGEIAGVEAETEAGEGAVALVEGEEGVTGVAGDVEETGAEGVEGEIEVVGGAGEAIVEGVVEGSTNRLGVVKVNKIKR